jgi:hypothetical protein
VVFPCAILHEVLRVTAGRRYAFLPFLFDENGANIGLINLRTTEENEKLETVPGNPNQNHPDLLI